MELKRFVKMLVFMSMACFFAFASFDNAKRLGLLPSGVSAFQAASVFTAVAGMIYAISSDLEDVLQERRRKQLPLRPGYDPLIEQISDVISRLDDPRDRTLLGVYRCSLSGFLLESDKEGFVLSVSAGSISLWSYRREGCDKLTLKRDTAVSLESIDKMRQVEEKGDHVVLAISKAASDQIFFAVRKEDLENIANSVAIAFECAAGK
jgi:hypothetical protein